MKREGVHFQVLAKAPVSSTGDLAVAETGQILLAWSPHSPGRGVMHGQPLSWLAQSSSQVGVMLAGWNPPCEHLGAQCQPEGVAGALAGMGPASWGTARRPICLESGERRRTTGLRLMW